MRKVRETAMNKRFRLISLIVCILTFAALFSSCGKDKQDDGTTDVYEIIDYSVPAYVQAEEEETFASFETPFRKEIRTAIYRLASESEKTGKDLEITGAFVSTEDTPTVVLSYENENGSVSLLVCKFRDGKLFRTVIETGSDRISAENDLLIMKNSDILVLRTGIGTETGRQVIYDFSYDEYCAVKASDFENGQTEDMDEMLKLYCEDTSKRILFSEKATTDNITEYLEKTLNIELADM